MGMHYGVLAADVTIIQLLELIRRTAPPLERIRHLEADEEIDVRVLVHDESWDLVSGELDGRAIVIDPSFMLSGMEPDWIAHVARETGRLAVGAAAETVSGAFALVIARGDRVLRHYHDSHARLRSAYSTGQPLACESSTPLDESDGNGLFCALREHGFDVGAFDARPKESCRWSGELPTAVLDGPLSTALSAHEAVHSIPPEEWLAPSVQPRLLPGGSVGFDLAVRRDAPRSPARAPQARRAWWKPW